MLLQHVQTVSKQLESTGILKIELAFCDDGSRYLEQLLLSLHKYLHHRLPISHSATRGWFWDIRPSAANFQTANYQARSETMEEFAWHTDCSYEDPTPRYFALQVLQPDRYGGGVLSLMNVQRLSERLSSTTRAALMRPEYRITIPPEFYKESENHYIDGSLLAVDSDGRPIMRFRGDIIQALTTEASRALDDLKRELKAAAAEPNFAMQLSAEDLPERTIVLVDNRRWLHARSPVTDAARHLRRVRWDAVPFHGIPPHIMDPDVYSLRDILAIARIHPFYRPEIQYPPDKSAIDAARKLEADQLADTNLKLFPLLWKKHLYTTIERLVNDTSSQNTYRHSIYASITGGGFGSKPLFFATDANENPRQRATFGRLLQKTAIVTPGDWVVTVHSAGELYRSLDLVLEVLENAGASVLSAGNHMSATEVVQLLVKYHVDVLTGDSSQVTQIVHHISSLSQEERRRIKICSMFASAEAGPWTASNPDITGSNNILGSVDFIFDTRTTLIEIFPYSCNQTDSSISDPLPEGEQGIVVQTSLTRLRNPLVRYVTGDIGSLHPLPDHARTLLSETDWQHFRVLRLVGRDRRFSFEWDGEYIELEGLTSLMEAEHAVLQWQVILGTMESSKESSLEIRVLCATVNQDEHPLLPQEAITTRLTDFLHVYDLNCHRFRLKFVGGMDDFERSETGRKVIKFIDRHNDNAPNRLVISRTP
ncbi:hypothetical protein GGS24DRAFT_491062 [Hypoxylon argillaceum]|nr:hypothetical protein GGS24DRAFT_491062 [Hypoxylon argillaceum]